MTMSDDLPRTLRREREARERAGQAGLSPLAAPSTYGPDPVVHDGLVMSGTTVTDVRIPFFRLVMICLKGALAAIPALILLTGFMWLAGHLLMTYMPSLVKLQILIKVP